MERGWVPKGEAGQEKVIINGYNKGYIIHIQKKSS